MMRTKEPLKAAIIGCGLIGQWHHIPSLRKIKDAEVVAICDENEDLVKQVESQVPARIGDFGKLDHRTFVKVHVIPPDFV